MELIEPTMCKLTERFWVSRLNFLKESFDVIIIFHTKNLIINVMIDFLPVMLSTAS